MHRMSKIFNGRVVFIWRHEITIIIITYVTRQKSPPWSWRWSDSPQKTVLLCHFRPLLPQYTQAVVILIHLLSITALLHIVIFRKPSLQIAKKFLLWTKDKLACCGLGQVCDCGSQKIRHRYSWASLKQNLTALNVNCTCKELFKF
jgi:hypothetical protein